MNDSTVSIYPLNWRLVTGLLLNQPFLLFCFRMVFDFYAIFCFNKEWSGLCSIKSRTISHHVIILHLGTSYSCVAMPFMGMIIWVTSQVWLSWSKVDIVTKHLENKGQSDSCFLWDMEYDQEFVVQEFGYLIGSLVSNFWCAEILTILTFKLFFHIGSVIWESGIWKNKWLIILWVIMFLTNDAI